MEPLQTCCRCPHLGRNDLAIPVYYCKKTDLVVPQNTDEAAAVFHRVPLSCPRPEAEVVKRRSGAMAPGKFRERIEHA